MDGEKEKLSSETDGEDQIQFGRDEEEKIVDGTRFVPFSMKRELENGEFVGNSYIEKEEEDVSSYDSTPGEVIEESEIKSSIKRLIELITPQNNCTEALQKCGKNAERLIEITNLASLLLISGESEVYTKSIDDLKKMLNKE